MFRHVGTQRVTPQCDFCAAPKPQWSFPCRDFTLTLPDGDVWASNGGWAACDTCKPLVLRKDADALFQRTTGAQAAEPLRGILRAASGRQWAAFWSHWSGTVEPIGPPRPGDGTISHYAAIPNPEDIPNILDDEGGHA
jgi:hypothetical protein